jgi:protein-S-isoprenylcysteine O-methyltransferase Ste14
MRILISRLYIALIAGAFLFIHSSWETRVPWVATVFFVLGIFMAGVGCLGRVWCSLHIAGRKQQQLVTDGPYSLLRNPLYFFSFIGATGVALTTGTLLFPAIVGLAFVLYYPKVIAAEEATLRKIHGEAFQRYAESVPSWFPSLAGWHEAATLTVGPAIFRRHLLSALWFVWALGVPVIVDALKHANWLPIWWETY